MGENPRVLALHAAGVTPAMWDDLAAELPELQLVAPDLLALHRRATTMEQLGAAAAALVPEGPVVVTGCAFGAHVALEAAAKLGSRLRGLLLLGPMSATPNDAFRLQIRAVAAMLDSSWSPEANRALVRILLYPFGPRHERASQQLTEMFDRAAARSASLCLVGAELGDAAPLLANIDAPIRVLFGAENGSPLPGPDVMETWRAAVGFHRVERVASAGEYLPLEQPAIVAGALRSLIG